MTPSPDPEMPAHDVPPVVLVVDDDRDAREMLCEFLRLSGFRAEEASDGTTALTAAERFQPALVFMDLAMPRMDGWEATRRLKAHKRTRDVIVVAASAHTRTNEVAQAFEAGCDGFIPKPLDLAVVAQTAESALSFGAVALPESIRRKPR